MHHIYTCINICVYMYVLCKCSFLFGSVHSFILKMLSPLFCLFAASLCVACWTPNGQWHNEWLAERYLHHPWWQLLQRPTTVDSHLCIVLHNTVVGVAMSTCTPARWKNSQMSHDFGRWLFLWCNIFYIFTFISILLDQRLLLLCAHQYFYTSFCSFDRICYFGMPLAGCLSCSLFRAKASDKKPRKFAT